jgi:hypothetical protein
MFKDRVIIKVPWNACANVDSMWNEISTHIRKMIIVVFGVTRGNKCESKDTW